MVSELKPTRLALAIPAALCFATAIIPASVEAQEQLLYCCEIGGKRNCGDALPPQCVGKAYSIRGAGGRLIRNVDAPMTAEQLKVREQLEQKKKEDEIARKEQARQDAALLATYASEAEIDKHRERAEVAAQAEVKAAEDRIATAEKKKRDAIGDPELYKKRGMPEDLKRKVREYDLEIRTQTELLDVKKKDLEAVRAKYVGERARYLELKSKLAVKR